MIYFALEQYRLTIRGLSISNIYTEKKQIIYPTSNWITTHIVGIFSKLCRYRLTRRELCDRYYLFINSPFLTFLYFDHLLQIMTNHELSCHYLHP